MDVFWSVLCTVACEAACAGGDKRAQLPGNARDAVPACHRPGWPSAARSGRCAACRGATEPVPCSARSASDGICSDVISF
ncbi:hypothetical protein EIQ30_05060 [Xanthomonas campestris]